MSTGEQLKWDGMDRVWENRPDEWKALAFKGLSALCRTQATVTADDVHAVVCDPPHPNMMGPLFVRHPDLEATEQFVKSTRKSRHSASIRVWKSKTYRGAQ